MYKTKYILLVFLSIVAISTNARVMSEQQISQLAKQYNSKSNGLYTCKSIGRTIIFTFPFEPNNDLSKENLINEYSGEEAANLATNAINVEYIYAVNGYVVNHIKIDWIDFLNLTYRGRNLYSTKNSPKSKDVSLQIVYPKGWNIEEGNGPHVVKKFEHNNDYINILIDDSPTFFSKNESIDLLNNSAPNLLDVNDLHRRFNAKFVDIYETNATNDYVGNYPAKKYYTNGVINLKGHQFHVLMITWFLLYEDRQITIGGMFFVESDLELKIKKHILESVVFTVRFPEQYTNQDYEKQ